MKKKQVFGNGCGFWERLRERLRKIMYKIYFSSDFQCIVLFQKSLKSNKQYT